MSLPQTLHCGPSGWSYPHWNGIVYPRLKPRHFHPLEELARYFDAVEINTSFYQPLQPELTALWLKKVAANEKFQFTVKLARRFTHERSLAPAEIARFKEGLWPLFRAHKLGCVLIQFPWTFRYTTENREFLIALRRAFHEFPLVAEMRHGSWLAEEALGTLIDYHIGFANIDQAAYTKAMPPSAVLTSPIGYVRLHGRNPRDWQREFGRANGALAAHDYLYSRQELAEWKPRIGEIREHAATTFVFCNNDVGGNAVVNALQLAQMLGDERHLAPAPLIEHFPDELADFHARIPVQDALFPAYPPERRAVA
ncbi:MAG TPA: DUF72 domain-containing protein [Bryobacteraceae bacterium]|nr:DUF72 domain-containing protein [Bryobacteraceae bacterium]